MNTKTKIIGGILILVVLFVAASTMWIRHNRASLSAEEVITRFYNSWYRENTAPGMAFEKRIHVRSTYASPALAQHVANTAIIENGTFAFDPVICGSIQQGRPGVNMVYEEDGRARAVLLDVTDGPINVFAVKAENDWWYVDEIDCPAGTRPAPAARNVEVGDDEEAVADDEAVIEGEVTE
jgi:hypothetical protein